MSAAMSNSFKKHPVTGVTCKESEKDYKASARRAYRRASKQRLSAGQPLPDEKQYGDPWGGPKDGKRYWLNHECDYRLMGK